jgi:signal transduction histidine kinase
MAGRVAVISEARERLLRVSAPMAAGPDTEPDPGSVGPLRPLSFSGAIAATGFLLASLPLGLFWVAVLVPPILLGVLLAVVWTLLVSLSLPLSRWTGTQPRPALVRGLALLFSPVASLSRRGAHAERRRAARSLGYPVPTPYRRTSQGTMLYPATWRDPAYLLLLLPVGVLEFAAVAAAFVCVVGTLTLPAWLFVAFPEGAPLWQDVRIDTLSEALVVAVVALPILAIVAYLLSIGMSRAHAALAATLLGPTRRERLAERVEALTESRSRAMEAAIAERRRIERDLHDGAQQRLVSLGMGLGMAKEKLAEDPEAARELVEEAHAEVKRVLAEMRDLVRGIHPAILTDRGLDAALSAICDRSPVPVSVDVRLDDERLPEAVETTAYFVAMEALSNAAKHSGSSAAGVTVWREAGPEDRLVVEVTDDGAGAAAPVANGGLSGLADRLAALDGRLLVQSPPGGPTLVRAEIPLGDGGEEVHRKP